MDLKKVKSILVVFSTIALISCNEDYNSIGENVIGGGELTMEGGENFGVVAYNKRVPAVQTNDLPINQLGILQNDAFGNTTAHFVTQLQLATVAPEIKTNPVIDSVVITVPYFSTKLRTEANGLGRYRLDSIYSNTPKTTNNENRTYDPIKLTIHKNEYTLNDVDSDDITQSARYYSNQYAAVDAVKGAVIFSAPNFVPDPKEYVGFKATTTAPFVKTTEVESRNTPRLRAVLKTPDNDVSLFQNEILLTNRTNLANNNNFKAHFKGLYFKVESHSSGKGTMMSLDFKKGDVTIYYKQDKVVNVGSEREMASLKLNMAGNTVNLFETTETNATYTAALSNSTITNGHSQLFLKGGMGSLTLIELFKNNELQDLKDKKVLVNDATLTFTVDETFLNSNKTGNNSYFYSPKRVYLYNADTGGLLYDYAYDSSTNQSDSKLGKMNYGGILTRENGKLVYRFNLALHISEVLKGNIENARLGLVVTEDINKASYGYLKPSFFAGYVNPATTAKEIKTYPVGAIMNPYGTVVYGNTNDDNRVKFKIRYTKPN